MNAFDWDTIEHYKRSLKDLLCSWALAYLMGVDKTWTPLLDPPFLDPSIFSVKKKKNNKFRWYTIRVLHTTASFEVYFPSIQRSAQKKVSPSTLRIFKFLFSIPERIMNKKTCHFQVAWTPAILFSAILVFPLTSTIEGHCSRPSTN